MLNHAFDAILVGMTVSFGLLLAALFTARYLTWPFHAASISANA